MVCATTKIDLRQTGVIADSVRNVALLGKSSSFEPAEPRRYSISFLCCRSRHRGFWYNTEIANPGELRFAG